MKVFVAGATGALGQPLVGRLVAAGHEVVGLTRTPAKRGLVESLGAAAAVADALDRDALARTLLAAGPEAVVHALTALPKGGPSRRAHFQATNLLRTQGTRNLLDAAVAAGARRLVAESMIYVYGVGDLGPQPVTEEDRLAAVDPAAAAVLEPVRRLEQLLVKAGDEARIEAIRLRYGLFYGPTAGSTQTMARLIRRRLFPLPGGGHGVASWIHIHDAAAATVAALERGRPGEAYNIADDQPVDLREFAGELARVIGAPLPHALPLWLTRVLFPFGTRLLTTNLPISNDKAKRELDWTPTYPTYREGYANRSTASATPHDPSPRPN